jgi:hypothetical protein
MIDGKPVDLVQYLLTAEDWAKAREQQLPLARVAGKEVPEWEKSQLELKCHPWDEIK